MSLIYNGTTIENAIYNGTTLEKIIFNGTEVFSAGFTLNITISSNTTNYNIASAATALGWDGVKKLKGTITINSGIYVYSTSTGTPAFSTGTMPSGSDVTVVNNGTILGKGGTGGRGQPNRINGTTGGTGFYATSAVKITNNGRISGGGGGGSGGGGAFDGDYLWPGTGGGGGIGNGVGGLCCGGLGSNWTSTAPPGSSGTLTSVGLPGEPANGLNTTRRGGVGGTYGSSGSTDPDSNTSYPPSSPGGGGAAVVGSANITWNATGTRNGAIS